MIKTITFLVTQNFPRFLSDTASIKFTDFLMNQKSYFLEVSLMYSLNIIYLSALSFHKQFLKRNEAYHTYSR